MGAMLPAARFCTITTGEKRVVAIKVFESLSCLVGVYSNFEPNFPQNLSKISTKFLHIFSTILTKLFLKYGILFWNSPKIIPNSFKVSWIYWEFSVFWEVLSISGKFIWILLQLIVTNIIQYYYLQNIWEIFTKSLTDKTETWMNINVAFHSKRYSFVGLISEKTYTRWRCYQHFTKVIMEDW